VRPRQARYQAALRPDRMHIDNSTVVFGFLPSELDSGACGLRAGRPPLLENRKQSRKVCVGLMQCTQSSGANRSSKRGALGGGWMHFRKPVASFWRAREILDLNVLF